MYNDTIFIGKHFHENMVGEVKLANFNVSLFKRYFYTAQHSTSPLYVRLFLYLLTDVRLFFRPSKRVLKKIFNKSLQLVGNSTVIHKIMGTIIAIIILGAIVTLEVQWLF